MSSTDERVLALRLARNCSILQRPQHRAELDMLAQQYLPAAPTSESSVEEVCCALAHRFAVDGLCLSSIIDRGTLVSINDRLWVGQKRGLTFVMERIDALEASWSERARARLDFWRAWAAQQEGAWREYARTYDQLLPSQRRTFTFPAEIQAPRERLTYFSAGLESFRWSVQHYSEHQELWVGAVLSSPHGGLLRSEADLDQVREVEMVVSVMTDRDLPVVAHMGIQRALPTRLPEASSAAVRPSHLALPLHAFAARVMRQRGLKHYLFSAPVPFMTRMLQRALPWNTYVSPREVGDVPETYEKALPLANESPLQYARSGQSFEVEWASFADPARRARLFEVTRDVRYEVNPFGDSEPPRDRVVLHPDDDVRNSITWYGQEARDRTGWLFHKDLLRGVALTPAVVVDYAALAALF